METSTNNFNKKKTKRIIFIGIVIVVIIAVLFLSFSDLKKISKIIKNVDGLNLTYSIICMLAFAFLSPLTLAILGKSKFFNISFKDSYIINMTEHFFNGITPFATGGQPIEIYLFHRTKVKTSAATSLLLMNLLIQIIATNIFAFLSLIYYNKFVATYKNLKIMVIFGFLMNLFVALFFISIASSAKVKKLVIKFLHFLCKSKLIHKYLYNSIDNVDGYFTQLQDSFKLLLKSKARFMVSLLIRIIALGFSYLIPFFVLKSLGVKLDNSDIFFIVSATAFATTIVAWLPTPGSSGGVEIAFRAIAISIIGSGSNTIAIAASGTLLWRLISYFLLMFVSFVFYIIFEVMMKARKKTEQFNNVSCEAYSDKSVMDKENN